MHIWRQSICNNYTDLEQSVLHPAEKNSIPCKRGQIARRTGQLFPVVFLFVNITKRIMFQWNKMKLINKHLLVPLSCLHLPFPRFNTLRPRQDGRHFPDDVFKWIFLNEEVCISVKISLKFVHRGPLNNIWALVQIMAWRRSGDKPLSEPMMASLLLHICVTRPQWVKWYAARTTFFSSEEWRNKVKLNFVSSTETW